MVVTRRFISREIMLAPMVVRTSATDDSGILAPEADVSMRAPIFSGVSLDSSV